MKHFIGILMMVTLLAGLHSCINTSIKKPDKLISKDQFVKVMVDMYLVQGINSGIVYPDSYKKLKPNDLYYSVLKKFSIADTVFIRSLIYYSSFPKEYDKLNLQVMDILKEKEQQFKPKDKLQVE